MSGSRGASPVVYHAPMELDGRFERQLEIAREVQVRLFPRVVPQIERLDLAAACIQARAVGGDYYDFLDFGSRQFGFVLADISGKGIHAALRMVGLQAHLRSQVINAPQDPLRVLRMVNQMLCESTDMGQFATLFLGAYAPASRRLTYINCGHNPPLLLRADGSVDRLEATATVIGAFPKWDCALGRTPLGAGDLFVGYSDGLTEASKHEEQFGEERLIATLRELSSLAPDRLVAALLERVQEFCGGAPADDLTLLVARGK